MRAVDIDRLQPGMVLASTIYTPEGTPLLREGIALTDRYIRSLRAMRYGFVYVADPRAPELLSPDPIAPQLRQSAITALKRMFGGGEVGPRQLRDQFKAIEGLTAQIVEAILANRDLTVQVVALKSHDNATFEHSVSVAILGTVLGHRLGLDDAALKDLALGLLLHDLGKRHIDGAILSADRPLTVEEDDLVRQHCRLGFDMLLGVSSIAATSKIVLLQHHEHYDGTGYPKALKGNEIHPYAQIAAIANTYDLLTAPHQGEFRQLPHQALKVLSIHSGTRFQPELVEQFLATVAPYPPGTYLQLSDQTVVLVVDVSMRHADRPIVKQVFDEAGRDLGAPYPVIDLFSRPELEIVRVRADIDLTPQQASRTASG